MTSKPDGYPECGDDLDPTTFYQILEMDDDDSNRDFSRHIVLDFFKQAKLTFDDMKTTLQDQSLAVPERMSKLYQLSHFLKGSSATIGLAKIRDHCGKIQDLGSEQNEDKTPKSESVSRDCLERIENILPTLDTDFASAVKRLDQFYGFGRGSLEGIFAGWNDFIDKVFK